MHKIMTGILGILKLLLLTDLIYTLKKQGGGCLKIHTLSSENPMRI